MNSKLLFSLIAEGSVKDLKKNKSKFSLQDFSAFDSEGRTPLHAATVSGRSDVVEWCIAQGANVNQRTQVVQEAGRIVSGGETALMIAAASGSLSCARVLLKEKALPSEKRPGDGLAAINLACRRRGNDLVQALLSFGAIPENVGVDGSFPLLDSCIRGDLECVSLLLKAKAGPDQLSREGKSCLMIACENGSLELVKLLLRGRANPNVLCDPEKYSALCYTLKGNCHIEVVKELIDYKAKNTSAKNGVTPLMLACKLGKTAELKILLGAKFSVNDVTPDNKSSLYYACKRLDESMVEMLLKAGANPSIVTPKGIPLMIFVLEMRSAAVAMLLLKFKPECCHVRSPVTGDTPLHVASQNGFTNVVESLVVKQKVVVNAVNSAGKTPADLTGSMECRKILQKGKRDVAVQVRRVLEVFFFQFLNSLQLPPVVATPPSSKKVELVVKPPNQIEPRTPNSGAEASVVAPPNPNVVTEAQRRNVVTVSNPNVVVTEAQRRNVVTVPNPNFVVTEAPNQNVVGRNTSKPGLDGAVKAENCVACKKPLKGRKFCPHCLTENSTVPIHSTVPVNEGGPAVGLSDRLQKINLRRIIVIGRECAERESVCSAIQQHVSLSLVGKIDIDMQMGNEEGSIFPHLTRSISKLRPGKAHAVVFVAVDGKARWSKKKKKKKKTKKLFALFFLFFSLSELMHVHFLCRNLFDGALYSKLVVVRTSFSGADKQMDLDRMCARSSLMRLLVKRVSPDRLVWCDSTLESMSNSLIDAVKGLNEEIVLPSDYEISQSVEKNLGVIA